MRGGDQRADDRGQRLARLWRVGCRRSVISRRRTLTRTDVYHLFATLTRDTEDAEDRRQISDVGCRRAEDR